MSWTSIKRAPISFNATGVFPWEDNGDQNVGLHWAGESDSGFIANAPELFDATHGYVTAIKQDGQPCQADLGKRQAMVTDGVWYGTAIPVECLDERVVD